ncbi:unnamed protein product, partial [Tilletia laevis]
MSPSRPTHIPPATSSIFTSPAIACITATRLLVSPGTHSTSRSRNTLFPSLPSTLRAPRHVVRCSSVQDPAVLVVSMLSAPISYWLLKESPEVFLLPPPLL